jgi:glucose-1-phosphate thymidylyltransferase
MKGIVFADKTNNSLYPIINNSINKYILPVYDKPMIYYPMSTLIACGIRDICIISCPEYLSSFRELFNDGTHLGLNIEYRAQYQQTGIIDCFTIAEDFFKNNIISIISADNIFHGMSRIKQTLEGALIFGYTLKHNNRHNEFILDKSNKIKYLETHEPIVYDDLDDMGRKYAIPDLYFFENSVISEIKKLKCTLDEVNMIDVLRLYLKNDQLKAIPFPKGNVWMTCDDIQSLYDTSTYIQAIQNRQGNVVGCIEEQCIHQTILTEENLLKIIQNMHDSKYKYYLESLV